MSTKKYHPKWLSFSQIWPSRHMGRWYKRMLSKARRRYWKMMLRFGKGKEPTNKEREVNYKGW